MKAVKYILTTGVLLASVAAFAAQPGNDKLARVISPTASRLAEFRFALAERIENGPAPSVLTVQEEVDRSGSKSVGKAVLFSAVVPGAGQFYSGSALKGVAFMAIEAATLFGYIHYQNRGNDLETEFERFADQNWIEDEYWNWLYGECTADPNYSGAPCQSIPGHQSLREYEDFRSDLSHFLPEEKNQQYYENIGKYDQFNIGWNDTGTGQGRDSEKRAEYVVMRKDANDNFKRATNMATITLFNHVLSALDAGISVKRHNKKIAEASLRMEGRLYNEELIPTMKLVVAW